jgi:hypothetical protein
VKIITNSFKAASYAGIFKLSGLVKISFLVGSQIAFFSGVNCVLPLAGAFGGVMGAGLLFVMRQLLHLLFFKTVSLSFLAMCIPGFCASLYWVNPSIHFLKTKNTQGERIFDIAIRLLLPLACMGLFIIHPVGAQAFIYSFYWLIPVGIYFIPRKSLFLNALGSTFVAHAVGSVIWCYTVPMTATMWMGLMPIVLLERTLFAMGMVVAYRILEFIFGKIDSLNIPQRFALPRFFMEAE